MRLFIWRLLSLVMSCFLSISAAWGQGNVVEKLNQGKDYFWQAKFDEAEDFLREVVTTEGVSREVLAEAYLYLGFTSIRQNTASSEGVGFLEQAVSLQPNLKLDEAIFPPFLVARYKGIRDRLVGCLFIQTSPSEVEIAVVDDDAVRQEAISPLFFCDLADRDLQVVVTDERFERVFLTHKLTAAAVDTLLIPVLAATKQSVVKKRRRLWPWLLTGGTVAVAATLVYSTLLDGGQSDGPILPRPPVRPDPGSN